MSNLVFTRERQEQFFLELQELINRYPETLEGLKGCYGDLDEEDEEDADRMALLDPFDPESPAYHSGIVLLTSIRNMQGYETRFVVTPPGQSCYLTDGLIANAFAYI